jgi:hypothetical protein
MAGSVAGTALRAVAQSALFGAAVDLLEHGRHHSEERDDQTSKGEKERGRLPERSIAGKTGLESGAEQCHAAGDEREQQEGCGQDVEVTSQAIMLTDPHEAPHRFHKLLG